MVDQLNTGYVLTFQGLCKIVLHVASAMSLPRCVIYLAWYVYDVCFGNIFSETFFHFFIIDNFIFVNQEFNPEPVVPAITARPDQVEKVLKTRYHDAKSKMPKDKEVDLLIVILPDNNGSLYGK
jgi:hypothetical protein